MEGRRVSRQAQKYNPLFILFLCLAAAVLVLLIVSIVLGARLKGANKKLDAAQADVAELNETVSELQEKLLTAEDRISALTRSGSAGESSDAPGPSLSDGPAAGASWLDLSGHSEVRVAPTELLDAYATYYTTAGVNLRSGPATSYDRITTVDFGTKVDVAAREGNWSFVRVGNRFGWINSDYLSTSQPAPQASSRRAEATSGNLH